MNRHLFRRAGVVVAVTLSLGAGLSITACTQMPTEKQGVSDMRPQISFQIERSDLASAEVLVDGDRATVIRQRESLTDLFRGEQLCA